MAEKLPPGARERIEKATVRVRSDAAGLGVFVGPKYSARCEPGYILTATHCVEHYGSGGMALGDYCLEKVRTHDGQELVSAIMVVEPVMDITVLEAPDGQTFYDECEAFEAFTDRIEPVPICTTEPPLAAFDDRGFQPPWSDKFPIHIYTHRGTWDEGTGQILRQGAPRLWVEAPIEGGTSGGPIVNERGELLAIVSHGGKNGGRHARPHRALPVWVWDKIISDQGGAS